MDGLEKVTLRFLEMERYDINIDEEVVCFQAITNLGSWSMETTIDGPADHRKKRDTFKEYVLQAIHDKEPPQEYAW